MSADTTTEVKSNCKCSSSQRESGSPLVVSVVIHSDTVQVVAVAEARKLS